ncbi:MAG: hypothetical protein A2001_11085 [Treponema sp. GWC1_61_84]|nr:MAG: hypothetical protein A2001_11085 [Treponema sp. GWC1_61_84]
MNNFNTYLARHGFQIIAEDKPPENIKEIELRLKLLEDEFNIDPSQTSIDVPPADEPDDEPPPADEKPEDKND